MTMMLHLQTVPARNGLLWIRHAFKVWQRKPLALTGLFLFWTCSALLMMALPAGFMLLIALAPLASLGFMLATHLVLQAQTPTVAVFFAPLKLTPERRRSQLLLCGAYLLGVMVMSSLLLWVQGDALGRAAQALQLEMAKDKPDTAAMNSIMLSSEVLIATAWNMTASALLSIPFWHAPALIHWGGQGVMQALFSSTLGLWRNRGAFALNGLAWVGLVLGFALLLQLLALLLGPFAMLPAMALTVIIPTLFYASLYFTFIDCFMFGAPRDLLSSKP
ncbi:BPSS1780 family membrane protein [Pelomonas sp. SE-A7]|uniref:BPSS1780 family membrane protein n=1 Tax=Pelomonas sp. SE-A7 TaxID=3054953 RepID=UPI00259D163B|nr:BPSS1780 family membrane protein [Pelomonas sp. SE-A7]MDM4767211.1 BPSS1780 family membrane protein [Pelomonas sp. SE-A7]